MHLLSSQLFRGRILYTFLRKHATEVLTQACSKNVVAEGKTQHAQKSTEGSRGTVSVLLNGQYWSGMHTFLAQSALAHISTSHMPSYLLSQVLS